MKPRRLTVKGVSTLKIVNYDVCPFFDYQCCICRLCGDSCESHQENLYMPEKCRCPLPLWGDDTESNIYPLSKLIGELEYIEMLIECNKCGMGLWEIHRLMERMKRLSIEWSD